jgi:hypothetical protein
MFRAFFFLAFSLCAAIAWAQPTRVVVGKLQNADVVALDSGDFRGAIILNEAAAGMKYYFALRGLASVADDPRWGTTVEDFLNLYLRKVDPKKGWIDDLRDYRSGEVEVPDSDDSYAALFLLTASIYGSTEPGSKWWARNVASITKIADQVLVDNILASGLTRTYSRHRMDFSEYPNLAPKDRDFKITMKDDAYLMDNCECYAGLTALANQLRRTKDASAEKYVKVASGIANGIEGLFHEEKEAFYVLESHKRAFPRFYETDIRFYPHRAAQAWPQLFSVPLGNAATTKRRYDCAWRYLNAGRDRNGWSRGFPADGSTDGFPWMALGCVAAMRGELEIARDQLEWHDRERRAKRWEFFQIYEIGDAHHAEMLLKNSIR